MSDDLRQAVEYAAWWTRRAASLASTEADAPLSVRRDLKAARPLLDVAERDLAAA